MRNVRSIFLIPLVVFAFLLMGLAIPADDDLVVNGSFETGDFTGWTQESMTAAEDWFVYSGTMIGLDTVLAPPDGMFAAITDQGDPNSNILYQDIEVPANSETTCSAIVYYVNQTMDVESVAGTFTRGLVAASPSEVTAEREFVIGDGLNIGMGDPSNQQYRVDIMDPEAPPFDTGAGVLLNLFQTLPGDPDTLGYTTLNFDLTPFAGQTVRIRAAVAVTINVLNGSIDAVTCNAVPTVRPIPTLSEWGLIALAAALGIVGILVYRRRLAGA